MLNVSLSYIANYFSTFCFRHDIWKERNRSLADPKKDGQGLSAADEEERLLAEEREQNTAIVALVCVCILHFSVQIVLK